MRKTRLRWILYSTYLITVVLAVGAVGGYASHTFAQFHLERRRADLEVRARLILEQVPDSFPATAPDSLTAFCRMLAGTASARVTLVSAEGRLLADSDVPRGSESVGYLPEISRALKGETSWSRRYFPEQQSDALYLALPVYRAGTVAGALRLAVPLSSLTPALNALGWRILLAGLGVAVLAALLSFLMARWFSRAIDRMREGAERFAAGDFATKVDLPATNELGGLAVALNHMAGQLDQKLRTITDQRNEQEAVLSSLREGVIAMDRDEHVLFVNRAAAELLDVNPERARGRLLQEVVRVSELQRFVRRLYEGSSPAAEDEVRVGVARDQILLVTGTTLRDAAGRRLGMLMVISDVTRLRKLETIRRDFVANVSHELKTPITSILGFVETLSDGVENAAEARTFLERIGRNADRLNAIIDDLLALSRIEQEGQQNAVPLEVSELMPVLETAIQAVSGRADLARIGVGLRCDGELRGRVNATLLEQAVVNLLDNAIKYSDAGRLVDVSAETDGAEIVIRVQDHGVGIAPEHLPRLFERFYRVDKARSRKLGGTGLGLAIVKHIVQAHGGSVTVESQPGLGSIFTIHLPNIDQRAQ